MKNVLIIGGSGYVGSELTELTESLVIDNLLAGMPPLRTLNCDFIHADIRDYNTMKALILETDIVVLLAGIVGEPSCVVDTSFSFDINVRGIINIISLIKPHQRLIFTSTSSVYGDRAGETVSEITTPKPLNHYSIHKMIAEQAIIERVDDFIILRPVTAFGVSGHIRLDLLVNTMIYEALSKGSIDVYEPHIIRPMIHVVDFARVLLYAIEGSLGSREIYNIGDPALTVTKGELAEKIAQMTGAKVNNIDGISLDPRNYDIRFQKLMNTGFTFTKDSLTLTIEQIQHNLEFIETYKDLLYSPNRVKAFLTKERE